MVSLRTSAGFSVAGLFTGLTLLAGVAVFCVPLVERRIESRARGARAAADRIGTTFSGDLDRFESLARSYGKAVLAGPPVVFAPPVPPPLPASPVEHIPPWFPPLRRPPPWGIPEWRPWRRRAPPFVWRGR
ncbi:MAG TPA: hypothetical protein VHV47_03125 [Opitutaceae bacterium]|jgi:hypothetical protein|nr:hypothetical protein [Opitutaceae bacterium]